MTELHLLLSAPPKTHVPRQSMPGHFEWNSVEIGGTARRRKQQAATEAASVLARIRLLLAAREADSGEAKAKQRQCRRLRNDGDDRRHSAGESTRAREREHCGKRLGGGRIENGSGLDA